MQNYMLLIYRVCIIVCGSIFVFKEKHVDNASSYNSRDVNASSTEKHLFRMLLILFRKIFGIYIRFVLCGPATYERIYLVFHVTSIDLKGLLTISWQLSLGKVNLAGH